MLAPFFSEHHNDSNGNPGGGVSSGRGFAISWQNGPLGRGNDRKEPNGAFVETIIATVVDRLEYYQDSRFACEANASAIANLRAAMDFLDARTSEREERKVEGTHEV